MLDNKKGVESEELSLKNGHEQVETKKTLWLAAQSTGAYCRNLLPPATGGTVIAGSCPAGGHLLEKQHGEL